MTIDATGEDRWSARAGHRSGRSRQLRLALRWVPAAILAGAVTGLLVHVVDTGPEGLSAAPAMTRMAMAVLLVLAIMLGALRAVLMDDPALVVAIPVFAVAGLAAYPLGPTWVPGATTAGTYSIRFESGVGDASGDLVCEWRAGRYRVAAFAASEPVTLPDDERYRLHASFGAGAVWLERIAADGSPRIPYADWRPSALNPPLDASLAPQRTVDGRSGHTGLVLSPDPTRPGGREDPSWAAPMSVDPGAPIHATLDWDCAAP